MRPLQIEASTAYIEGLFAREDTLLQEMRTQLHPSLQGIQVSPLEGALLQWLVRLRQPKRLLEIGTLVGYSALWMARGLPLNGHLYTIERDTERAIAARNYISRSEVASRITVYEGSAGDVIPTITEQGPLDMVFIDADKGNYYQYLTLLEPWLSPKALIVADNTFLFGSIWQEVPPSGVSKRSWDKMRRFNEYMAAEYDSMLIPTMEGLTIGIKR